MQSKLKNIHMVGIGGAGMSGIAEVLLNLGYKVSGSDLSDSAVVQRLRSLGANIFKGHQASNLGDAQVLVKSTAVHYDNPELQQARENAIPIIPRAEMLAELMRLRTGIAIAGTHGKTTTTSLVAAIFDAAGADSTVIIGGRLNTYGANARLGAGKYLLAEADESDGSFLCLFSIMNIITNIDCDHLDHYKDQNEIDDAFVAFMNKVPFYGVNVVCGDDRGVKRVLARVNRPVVTYGFGAENDIRAEIISCANKSIFKVFVKEKLLGEVSLAHPGKHNILNALGAIGLALEAGLPASACLEGLSKFEGVGRRFELKGERNGVVVIDDYGHHPAEIAATLATAKQCYPNQRLIVAFQPHRFTRTQALFGDFCTCFNSIDKLLLTEIYPASESPIPGVSGQSLAQGIRQVSNIDVEYCQNFDAVVAQLSVVLKPGDVFITLGAGSIYTVGQRFLAGE